MQPERLDAIIADLYEAAFDPDRWDDALLNVAQLQSADNYHLMVWNPAQPHPLHSLTWGMDAAVEAAYRAHYGAIDPRRLLAAQLPDGEWLACHRYFPEREVARHEFFQDYLIPGGIRYLMGTRLTRHNGFDIYFGMHRAPGRPAFSDGDVAAMDRLTGHFQRVMRLWLETESLRQRVALGERALDAFGSGVFAINATGYVLYANRCAEAMLKAGPISTRQGVLTASNQEEAARLDKAIQAALTKQQPSSLRVRADSGEGRRDCALTIIPLRPTHQLSAGFWHADLLVLITPTARRLLTVRQLMEVFGLTPAEARLARAIASGETVRGFSEENGVGVATARTQMKAVLEKLRVARQADVVRQLVVLPVTR